MVGLLPVSASRLHRKLSKRASVKFLCPPQSSRQVFLLLPPTASSIMTTTPLSTEECAASNPSTASSKGPTSSSSSSSSSSPSPPGAYWSLCIKPVGCEEHHSSSGNAVVPGALTTTAESGVPPSQVHLPRLRDFAIQVSPNDSLTTLYDRIEAVTGLQAHQQRLIYRGQLLGGRSRGNNNSNSSNSTTVHAAAAAKPITAVSPNDGSTTSPSDVEPKIKDVRGLCDGQTIHLVRKREVAVVAASTPPPSSLNAAPSAVGVEAGDDGAGGASAPSAEVLGTSGAAPLLAALLGLGGGGAATTTDPARASGTPEVVRNPPRARSTRGTPTMGASAYSSSTPSSSRRRFNHRLTSDDLDIPDPGSLEPVRQGLLTLHTLLPHAQAQAASAAASSSTAATSSTHDSVPRRWYVGQWIDCLDTVNQWLEATVVEIALPDDVLPTRRLRPHGTTTTTGAAAPLSRRHRSYRASASSTTDSVVTAHDLDGRQMLLLEPVHPESDEEGGQESDETQDGARDGPTDIDDDEFDGGEYRGYRRRDADDAGIQLLLIHYNGWPHRWDEWIRSDSPRLRPFRARTRHPNASTFASPTPQSLLPEPPSTHLRQRHPASDEQPDAVDDDESSDRAALVPELLRVSDAVHELVRAAAVHLQAREQLARERTSDSPVADNEPAQSLGRAHLPWAGLGPPHSGAAAQNDFESEVTNDPPRVNGISAAGLRAELEALAPLLDRLGRTLVDAAPHVAALARSIEAEPMGHPVPVTTAHGLSVTSPEAATTGSGGDDSNDHPTSLGGLLSLLGRDRRRQSNSSSSNIVVPGDAPSVPDEDGAPSTPTRTSGADSTEVADVDPDLTDFASAAVNTTRGEVRRGPRSNRSSSGIGSDDAAGLLGAYLAAASLNSLAGGGSSGTDGDDGGNNWQGLGRLLRERGAGGGIDIHIHAVVTAPGLPTGGLGLTAIGAGGAGLGGVGAVGGLFGATAALDPANEAPTSPFSTRGGLIRPGSSRLTLSRSPPTPVGAGDDEDDDGIFSELYSDNPDPIDPSRPPGTTSNPLSTPPARRHSRTDVALGLVSRSPARNGSSSSSSNSARTSTPGDRNYGSRRNNSGGGSSVWGRFFRRNPSSDA